LVGCVSQWGFFAAMRSQGFRRIGKRWSKSLLAALGFLPARAVIFSFSI
jgi:hypothetical protein